MQKSLSVLIWPYGISIHSPTICTNLRLPKTPQDPFRSQENVHYTFSSQLGWTQTSCHPLNNPFFSLLLQEAWLIENLLMVLKLTNCICLGSLPLSPKDCIVPPPFFLNLNSSYIPLSSSIPSKEGISCPTLPLWLTSHTPMPKSPLLSYIVIYPFYSL